MKIAKNTNKAKQVIANAHDIRCFSLSNNFSGEPLAANPVVWGGPVVDNRYTEMVAVSPAQFLTREMAGRNSKLISTEHGRYTIHVHSNLWYSFKA